MFRYILIYPTLAPAVYPVLCALGMPSQPHPIQISRIPVLSGAGRAFAGRLWSLTHPLPGLKPGAS